MTGPDDLSDWYPVAPTSQKERPRLGETFLSTHPLFDQPRGVAELPILVLLALLAGLLTLAVRILLLLSGFLPAALLLTRLLSRVLVLLAGILVLIGHCDLPFSKSRGDNCGTHHWLRRKLGSALAFSGSSTPWFRRPLAQRDKNDLCTSS